MGVFLRIWIPHFCADTRQDFRFHLELQRNSAKTANANADSLQNEVHLLRAFMTNRLGLPCSTLPTAAAKGNGRSTGTSSPTVRY